MSSQRLVVIETDRPAVKSCTHACRPRMTACGPKCLSGQPCRAVRGAWVASALACPSHGSTRATLVREASPAHVNRTNWTVSLLPAHFIFVMSRCWSVLMLVVHQTF